MGDVSVDGRRREGVVVMRRTAMLLMAGVLLGSLALHPAPAGADTTIEKIATRVVVLSDHSTPVKTWSPLEVRARVETLDGTPLAGRTVRVWDDSYERWRCCGPPPELTTDSNGEIATVLHLDGNSENPVRVAVYTYGDDIYEKSIAEWYQPLIGYDTSLDVMHSTSTASGGTLPVTVSVRRVDPAVSETCIDGAVVQLEISGPSPQTATAVVEHDALADTCDATVGIPWSVTPGSYTIVATTGHDGWHRTDEPQRRVSQVEVSWEHTYHDAHGHGTLRLNRATQEYRVSLADGRDSGVRHADVLSKTGISGTLSLWRIDLADDDSTDHVTGEFYSTGAFTAHGSLDGSSWQLGR